MIQQSHYWAYTLENCNSKRHMYLNVQVSWWLSGKESTCQCRRCGLGRFPGEGNGNLVQPGKSHGQRSLEGFSSWGHKELDMT